MIVTSIIRIQAAITVPAFIKYVRESKTAEAGLNLKAIGDVTALPWKLSSPSDATKSKIPRSSSSTR